MIRIAITGPESSGKTTLARDLLEEIGIDSCPEFAREYLNNRQGNYSFSDLDTIALRQVEIWKKATSHLICDTEMTVIKIWSEVKFGKVSPIVMDLYKKQVFDHYFLCRPDIPWESDPLREDPGRREWLFKLYEKELYTLQRPFTILEGSKNNRLKECMNFLQKLNLF
jgi:nicotinamide riboside kinase